jgi:Ca2+-binding RTX toxin-like protein
VVGDRGSDRIVISSKRSGDGEELYYGGAGDDVIVSAHGSITGEAGNDYLRGQSLDGGSGNDRLLGFRGTQAAFVGGTGNDVLIGNSLPSFMGPLPGGSIENGGGPGNDRIVVVNGRREDGPVDCGSGHDRVRADRIDSLRRCETVIRR